MSDEQMVASGSTESSPAETPEGSAQDLKAENTKLRQKNAEVLNFIRENEGTFRLGEALQKAPGGAAIIQQLQDGKPLTSAQEAQVTAEAEQAGMNPQQIADLLDEKLQAHRQEIRNEELARQKVNELHGKLGKKLPGYDALYKTPQWRNRYDTVYQQVAAGIITAPPEVDDVYEWMAEATYQGLLAENPDLGKVQPAKKTEDERRASITRASASQAGAAPTGDDGLPEGLSEDERERLAFARRRPARTVGKSFSNPSS